MKTVFKAQCGLYRPRHRENKITGRLAPSPLLCLKLEKQLPQPSPSLKLESCSGQRPGPWAGSRAFPEVRGKVCAEALVFSFARGLLGALKCDNSSDHISDLIKERDAQLDATSYSPADPARLGLPQHRDDGSRTMPRT